MVKPAVPPFPLLGEPGDFPVLVLLASTIFLEAEAEPFEGMLGIGWVIRRRALGWGLGWHATVLGPDERAYEDDKAFEPFSCWNNEYWARARARLSSASEDAAEPCWRAAAGALWELLPDPVGGASFYLNVEATKRIRSGSLPTWAADPADATKLNEAKVAAVIGRHHFLRG